ncbi:hypothetical protein RF11_10776 [Thelohanellus kitauei]|uniref:Uncharacterized protein n=1 Tax=Thelohanellus kitauei TaxID=669202 RepID=A0A0C2ML25_THEKT|nr:hypothetical protein RF11_10776 [Thelohanellus kitauei]
MYVILKLHLTINRKYRNSPRRFGPEQPGLSEAFCSDIWKDQLNPQNGSDHHFDISLDLLGFVTKLSQCLILAYKSATPLVLRRGRPMPLSLSGETDIFKSRTAKEKRIRTDNPLVEIRLEGVGHLQLYVEKKSSYRQ